MKLKICRYLVLTGALSVLFLAGCGRDEKPQGAPAEGTAAVSPAAEEDFMKDPEFRRKLAEERRMGDHLRAQKTKIAEELQHRTNLILSKSPDASDEEKLRLLEADAEWRSLRRRLEDLVQAVSESDARRLAIARGKIGDRQQISK